MRKASIIAMAALALLTAQCKKNEPKPEEKVMVPITGSLDFGGSKTAITTTGYITPVTGDVIYIYKDNSCKGSMTCTAAQTGQQFTCSGEIDGSCLGETCTFMYLGSNNGINGQTNNTITISFANQTDVSVSNDGKILGLEKFHVGSCQAQVSDDGKVTLNMATKMSIAYFKLTDGTNPIKNRIVTISGVYATANIDKENGTISYNSTGNITVKTDAEGKFYMALVPQSGPVPFTFSGPCDGTTTFSYGIRECSFYSEQGSGNPLQVTVTPVHEIVNMGLPEPYENLEWSKYNLGVNPDELDAAADWYGDFYAWGATDTWYSSLSPLTWKPGYSSGYAWETCPGNGGNSSFNAGEFATWKSENLTTSNTLSPEVDAAHVIWGGDWRMPTTTEWKALYDNTTLEWVDSYEGVAVSGCLLKNKLDPSKELFLPAAGLFVGTSHNVAGTMGDYWSSTVVSSSLNKAYRVYFGYEDGAWMYPQNSTERVYGFPVRPVRDVE